MFDNIQYIGEAYTGAEWICFLDEPYEGNHLAYAGDFYNGQPCDVTASDVYWD